METRLLNTLTKHGQARLIIHQDPSGPLEYHDKSMNVVGFRLWLRINVCQATITTARVSYLSAELIIIIIIMLLQSENTTTVFSTCQLNGTWSPVSLTCMSQSGLLQGEHSDQHFYFYQSSQPPPRAVVQSCVDT